MVSSRSRLLCVRRASPRPPRLVLELTLLPFARSFSEQFTLMLVHLAVSFPVRRLVARHTELQRRGELFEQAGKVVLQAPMVRALSLSLSL